MSDKQWTGPRQFKGIDIIPIQTDAPTILENVRNTVNAAGRRIIVDLRPVLEHAAEETR